MRKHILIIALTIFSIAPNVFAQSVVTVGSANNRTDPNAWERARVINQIRRQQESNDRDTMTRVKSTFGSGYSSYSSNNITEKIVKKVKKTGFENEYKQFLKQPNTGLVKLLKEQDCLAIFNAEDHYDIKKGIKACPGYFVPGKLVHYSFRHDDYVSSKRSDIGLMNDWLFSTGMLNQSLMVDLGEVNLDELNAQSEGIKFLFDFVPETNLDLADKQRENILKGIKDKNYLYSNAIKFKKNSVIGLRVVAYNGENKIHSNRNPTLDLIARDNRKDIIIAFKVIDKADDGSVVLLWKQLQTKAAPALVVEN